jgi:hypothetical protein
VLLATIFQAARAGIDQSSFQESLTKAGVQLDTENPLIEFLSTLTWLMPPLYVLYLYFGAIFDAFYATITSVTAPVAPITSLTLPILYRRIVDILDFPTWESLRYDNFFGVIQKNYGVFPRVWNSMFGPLYLEGSWVLICLFTIFLMYVHTILIKKYLLSPRRDDTDSLSGLIVFYSCLAIGLIVFPTQDTGIVTLIFATLAKPYISNMLVYRKY